jgi:integrase
MLGTAARPDAIFDLTFDRCDFESELIVLNPPGREQTKKHRPTVKMPRSLIPMLRHASQTRECIHVLSHNGEPLQSVRRRWRMARAATRMDDRISPYSLRHTMARWLRKESVSAWETAAQLGHKRKDVSTTEIYAPFSPDYLEASVSAIDAFFDRLRTICVPVDEMLKGR